VTLRRYVRAILLHLDTWLPQWPCPAFWHFFLFFALLTESSLFSLALMCIDMFYWFCNAPVAIFRNRRTRNWWWWRWCHMTLICLYLWCSIDKHGINEMNLSRGKMMVWLSVNGENFGQDAGAVRRSTRHKFVSTRLRNYDVSCAFCMHYIVLWM